MRTFKQKAMIIPTFDSNGASNGEGVTIRNQNKTITENGSYKADSGYTGLGTVTVNVPIPEIPEPVLEELTISENGEYTPSDGVDGFSKVIANIATNSGGGAEKIYETDFVVDSSAVDGVLCTISTGLAEDVVYADREIVSVIITCEPTTTPSKRWVKKTQQFLVPNQGATSIQSGYQYVEVDTSGNEINDSRTSKYGTYLSAVSNNLSSLTISAWISGNNYAPIGNYHLEIYRIGVVM